MYYMSHLAGVVGEAKDRRAKSDNTQSSVVTRRAVIQNIHLTMTLTVLTKTI